MKLNDCVVDEFLIHMIGFNNAYENIKFVQKEFPEKTDVINKLRLNRSEHMSKLGDLCVVLGDEKCRDLIGGVTYCRLLQNMREDS